VNTRPQPVQPHQAVDARALLAAATAGARRALRGYPLDQVDEAAAAAITSVTAALAGGYPARAPLSFAAVAGRNAAADLRRALVREADRLVPWDTLPDSPATLSRAGWLCQDARLQVLDVLALALAEAARRPTRELAAVTRALASLVAGEPIDGLTDSERRRLARGTARLAALAA
jgi:hypothetical protein